MAHELADASQLRRERRHNGLVFKSICDIYHGRVTPRSDELTILSNMSDKYPLEVCRGVAQP